MTTAIKERPLTPKQDRFARFLFQGLSQREAYIQAGYSSNQLPDTIDRVACALASNYKVVARYNELRAQADKEAIMSRDECLKRLSEIGRTNLTDFMELGQDGSWVNLGSETKGTAAIQEIHSRTEYDDDGSHSTVHTSVKLHDPMKAIDMICKLEGHYAPEKKDITERKLEINVIEVRLADGSNSRQALP